MKCHVTLDCKSPEPVLFGAEVTLGMVPTTGAFLAKIFCTKCTEEEFVIGQMLRCSGMDHLCLCFFQPLLFPGSDFVRFPSGWNFGRKKLMSENRDTVTTCSKLEGGGERCRCHFFEVNRTNIE